MVPALPVAPAAVAGNGSGGSEKAVVDYSPSGNETAVDADNGVVSVSVAKADKAARAYNGETVDLKVATTTLHRGRTADCERVAVTLADITAGDRITSPGKLDKAAGTSAQRRCPSSAQAAMPVVANPASATGSAQMTTEMCETSRL